MKRLFIIVARFFWSWGFLKFFLWTITLMVFLYVEENWRGAHAWAATKAKWEARGESFDLDKFVPSSIPDDENLGAIQLFKRELVLDGGGRSYPDDVILKRALRTEGFLWEELPAPVHWMKGELPDLDKVRINVARAYAAAFKGSALPPSALQQWQAIYPFMAELRTASATRPVFRSPEDYTVWPPENRGLGPLTREVLLSRILAIHATLALDEHQSGVALDDLKVNVKIASGVKRDPSLVAGFVALGMIAIGNGVIYDGLVGHQWSDAQLIELDSLLRPINFLTDYQFVMRSMAAAEIANVEYFKSARKFDIYGTFMPGDEPLMVKLSPPWVAGWWELNKSQMADFILCMPAAVDPVKRRAFPKLNHEFQRQADLAGDRWDAYAPWNLWVTVALGPLENTMNKYAMAQVWVDEARIACALERYHLKHGTYPASLDALAPSFIEDVPHDIMNGDAYHYRLRPDGAFDLYSVGGNQEDDGGKVVFEKDYPNQVSFYEGDWVWPKR